MRTFETVSAVLINKNGQICLFKRVSTKRLNPNKWNVIAEKVKINSFDYVNEIIRGVKEETGIKIKVENILLPLVIWYVFNPKNEINSNGVLCRDRTFLVFVNHSDKIVLNSEHSEYTWIDPQSISLYDVVPFLSEALHNVGITLRADSIYKVLYQNYKGEIKWRFIHPIKYYFGHTDYHPKDQWLLKCFDVEKDAERTYAVGDIKVLTPPVY